MPNEFSTADRIVQLNAEIGKLITASKLQTGAIESVAEAMRCQAAATMAATRIGPHGAGLTNDDIAGRFHEAYHAMFKKG